MASPSQVAPSWLARLDEMAADIIPSTYPIETDTLGIIKKLLLAQGDDNAAVGEAVHEIRSFYTTKLFPPNDPFYRDLPDHGVSQVVGAVVDHVFELASAVPWKESAHKRLADLLIALKENATTTGFDPADPQLGWESSNLEWHAAEIWRSYNPTHTASQQECTEALRTHVLLARLVAADLLPADGPWRTAQCVSEGLNTNNNNNNNSGGGGGVGGSWEADTALVRTCRAAIAARYLVLAGRALPRELRRAPGPDTEAVVRKAEWAAWAERLRRLASASSSSSPPAAAAGGSDGDDLVAVAEVPEEWDLKAGAAEAARQVEIWLSGQV